MSKEYEQFKNATFKERLYHIKETLEAIPNRETILTNCVNKKLDSSLIVYNREIDKLCKKLLNKSNSSLIRTTANVLSNNEGV